MSVGRVGAFIFIALDSACDGPSVPAVDAGIDAGHTASDPDARSVCQRDRDCDDGVFCNGGERCMPGATGCGFSSSWTCTTGWDDLPLRCR